MVDDNEDIIATLLLKWEEAWDLGEDLSPAELCSNRPDLQDKLADQINLLKSMNWMKHDAADDSNDDDNDELIGRTLAGRYRIDELVGSGGHGRVYKAFDPELERHVAVKVSKTVASPEQSEQLLEEARRAAKLKHPGIVAVHDVGRHDGQLFFVTELVEGKNLADIIENDRPNIIESKRIVCDVGASLHFAHQQGFLHRDIKPANFLIDEHGRVLVTDFGIATTIDKIEDHRGGTPGTLPYMAPEQIAGEVQLIDARTDIHALGVVLYELLTGQLPYQGRTPTAVREQILLRQPKPPSAYNKAISKQLEAVCLKCLAKHPADRFETANDVGIAISAKESTLSKQWLAGLILSLVAAMGIWMFWPSALSRETASQNSPVRSEGAFVFTGTERIVTPLMRRAPVTLEAWIDPEITDINCHFIIGGDVRGEFGVSVGICGAVLAAETVPQMVKSNEVVRPGQWSHVCAVFGKTDTRLYLNGKLVHTGPATKAVAPNAHFVVGNVSEDTPIDYFAGKIRSVRISDGERYSDDFQPDESFAPIKEANKSALLIYDGTQFEGGIAKDLSGNGNDGRWESFAR
ncbi:protein kinase [Stieleria sp. JC731]|uniref:protein kinase domain-containing protein n=1 Tax=Pirellulaceae TaxID=2691357 RepID=UPI001E361EA8|nr:protein kinase [Stieleria sp. JC731]MCC9602856.1 protein kinase [Stieleria sp. JC731]